MCAHKNMVSLHVGWPEEQVVGSRAADYISTHFSEPVKGKIKHLTEIKRLRLMKGTFLRLGY